VAATDLDAEMEMFGRKRTLGRVLTVILGHAYEHAGEIACLKGLQGGKGYPV
jgi:hypothetical protein